MEDADAAGWAELERLAQAATAADASLAFEHPSHETLARWEKLSGYSETETASLIGQQRSDVTRERITDDHWNLVGEEKEKAGHDRESYEHSLQLKRVFDSQSASIPHPDGGLVLLFRLGGLLNSALKVQEVAGLDEPPVEQEGWSERGPVRFVMVDEAAKKKLEEYLVQQSVLQS